MPAIGTVGAVRSVSASAMEFPPCPDSLRPIAHYLKTAAEHAGRDACAVYWCRLHALQLALKLSTKKTPEETALLVALMDWLENEKKAQRDNETITNEVAAQAHLENYALKLFLYADRQDREGNYGKNVVKAFYTSGMIYDVLVTFGELTDEVTQNRKYAKWKAAYIHNCLKNGEIPVPGPMQSEENETEDGNASLDVGEESAANDRKPETADNTNFDAPPSNPYASASNVLPSVPHSPDANPGGFHAFTPEVTQYVNNDKCNAVLTPEQMAKAQKYCKWAASALNYDDVKTAISNLQNALQLLQTGHDPA